MTLIKYYQLMAGDSLYKTKLENICHSLLLQQNAVVMNDGVKEIIPLEDGDTLAELPPSAALSADSHLFDRLFYSVQIHASGISSYFDKYTLTLVVKASEPSLQALETKMAAISSLEVQEARVVALASASFTTDYMSRDHAAHFHDAFMQLATQKYHDVTLDLRKLDTLTFFLEKRIAYLGLLHGPIEQVLPFWELIRGGGYDVPIKKKNIVFEGPMEMEKKNASDDLAKGGLKISVEKKDVEENREINKKETRIVPAEEDDIKGSPSPKNRIGPGWDGGD